MSNTDLFEIGMGVNAVKSANSQTWEDNPHLQHQQREQLREAQDALAELGQEADQRKETQAQMVQEEENLSLAIALLQAEIEQEQVAEQAETKSDPPSPTRSKQEIMDMIAEAEQLAQESCVSLPSPSA